jgi:hypothetical protein
MHHNKLKTIYEQESRKDVFQVTSDRSFSPGRTRHIAWVSRPHKEFTLESRNPTTNATPLQTVEPLVKVRLSNSTTSGVSSPQPPAQGRKKPSTPAPLSVLHNKQEQTAHPEVEPQPLTSPVYQDTSFELFVEPDAIDGCLNQLTQFKPLVQWPHLHALAFSRGYCVSLGVWASIFTVYTISHPYLGLEDVVWSAAPLVLNVWFVGVELCTRFDRKLLWRVMNRFQAVFLLVSCLVVGTAGAVGSWSNQKSAPLDMLISVTYLTSMPLSVIFDAAPVYPTKLKIFVLVLHTLVVMQRLAKMQTFPVGSQTKICLPEIEVCLYLRSTITSALWNLLVFMFSNSIKTYRRPGQLFTVCCRVDFKVSHVSHVEALSANYTEPMVSSVSKHKLPPTTPNTGGSKASSQGPPLRNLSLMDPDSAHHTMCKTVARVVDRYNRRRLSRLTLVTKHTSNRKEKSRLTEELKPKINHLGDTRETAPHPTKPATTHFYSHRQLRKKGPEQTQVDCAGGVPFKSPDVYGKSHSAVLGRRSAAVGPSLLGGDDEIMSESMVMRWVLTEFYTRFLTKHKLVRVVRLLSLRSVAVHRVYTHGVFPALLGFVVLVCTWSALDTSSWAGLTLVNLAVVLSTLLMLALEGTQSDLFVAQLSLKHFEVWYLLGNAMVHLVTGVTTSSSTVDISLVTRHWLIFCGVCLVTSLDSMILYSHRRKLILVSFSLANLIRIMCVIMFVPSGDGAREEFQFSMARQLYVSTSSNMCVFQAKMLVKLLLHATSLNIVVAPVHLELLSDSRQPPKNTIKAELIN